MKKVRDFLWLVIVGGGWFSLAYFLSEGYTVKDQPTQIVAGWTFELEEAAVFELAPVEGAAATVISPQKTKMVVSSVMLVAKQGSVGVWNVVEGSLQLTSTDSHFLANIRMLPVYGALGIFVSFLGAAAIWYIPYWHFSWKL